MARNAMLPPDERYSTASIGRRLQALRLAHDLPQVIIADECGLEPWAWNAAERGQACLSWQYATLIAEKTHVTLDYIFRDRYDGINPKLVAALKQWRKRIESGVEIKHTEEQLELMRKRRERLKKLKAEWRANDTLPVKFKF